MTEPTTGRPKSTRLVRIAGVLFVISALATIVKQAIGQYMEYSVFSGLGDTDPEYEFLGTQIMLVIVEAGALILAFVLVAVWFAKPLPTTAFLLLAVAIPTQFVVELHSGTQLAVDIVYAALALFAGIVVLVRGLFGRGTRIIFLLAMLLFILQFAASMTGFLYATLWLEPLASYLLAAVYLVFGIALYFRPQNAKSPAREQVPT